jgi:excisionase family DNA binding protein
MIQNYAHEGREPSKNFATLGTTIPQPNGDSPRNARFLSKEELSVALGVSSRTIDNWVAQRRIPRLKLSPRLARFNLLRVEAALERFEVKERGVR